jgi:hypothetical protein
VTGGNRNYPILGGVKTISIRAFETHDISHRRVTEGAEELVFCLSGEDDKQKESSPCRRIYGRNHESFIENRRLPILCKKVFLSELCA